MSTPGVGALRLGAVATCTFHIPRTDTVAAVAHVDASLDKNATMTTLQQPLVVSGSVVKADLANNQLVLCVTAASRWDDNGGAILPPAATGAAAGEMTTAAPPRYVTVPCRELRELNVEWATCQRPWLPRWQSSAVSISRRLLPDVRARRSATELLSPGFYGSSSTGLPIVARTGELLDASLSRRCLYWAAFVLPEYHLLLRGALCELLASPPHTAAGAPEGTRRGSPEGGGHAASCHYFDSHWQQAADDSHVFPRSWKHAAEFSPAIVTKAEFHCTLEFLGYGAARRNDQSHGKPAPPASHAAATAGKDWAAVEGRVTRLRLDFTASNDRVAAAAVTIDDPVVARYCANPQSHITLALLTPDASAKESNDLLEAVVRIGGHGSRQTLLSRLAAAGGRLRLSLLDDSGGTTAPAAAVTVCVCLCHGHHRDVLGVVSAAAQ